MFLGNMENSKAAAGNTWDEPEVPYMSEKKLLKVLKCQLQSSPMSTNVNIWASVRLASTMIWNTSNVSQSICS